MAINSKFKTFSNEVREAVFNAYNGYCSAKGCLNKAIEFHHRIKNSKANREKFKYFLQSPMNCAPTCRHHHIHKTVFEMPESVAVVIEEWLRKLKEKEDV